MNPAQAVIAQPYRGRGRLLWVMRRMVLAPMVIVLATALWVVLPVWLVIAAMASPLIKGRLRPLRILWMLIMGLTIEALLLVVLFGWWLASGFGRRIRSPYFEGLHYEAVELSMWLMFREAERVLRLKIVTDGDTPDLLPGSPLLVACRHAGPGDSFTLIHALMNTYAREPRVVLKETLAWDPTMDVLLRRIPASFIAPGSGDDLETLVGGLASGLDANDAFVIFPEGGNFTAKRRDRSITRLRELGLEAMAQRAEQMTTVLAPRPGGLLAALDAAPNADVVLVAHTGLEHLVTATDIWRELPTDKTLTMKWWRVPRSEIPDGRAERIEWLFDRWAEIDLWVREFEA